MGYEKDDPSYEFLKTEIFEQTSNRNQDIQTIYTLNLKRAKDFFQEQIQDNNIHDLAVLFNKITFNLKFNMYFIDSIFEVCVAFETMNNRGKNLSTLELLKNRLMYISTKLPNVAQDEKNRLRYDVNECWKTVYEYLGKNPLNPLRDDSFLKDHWIMYFQYSRETAKDYKNFLLKKEFTIDNVIKGIKTLEDIQRFIISIQKSIKYWYILQNPTDNLLTQVFGVDSSLIEWLSKIKRLNFGAFRPLIMAAFNIDERDENLAELLDTIENCLFSIFQISRARSSKGDSKFYGFARQLYTKSTSIRTIIDEIAQWKEENFDIELFQKYIKNRFNKQEDGFYGWSGLHYFLYEYELKLKEKAGNADNKLNWDQFIKSYTNKVSIEHILPQSRSNPEWNRIIENYSQAEQIILTHTLGNLLALSRHKNVILQDKNFGLKKRDGDVGYYNGSYNEIAVAQYHQWTAKEILERGLDMMDFMCENWGITLTKDVKLNILHLNFL